MNCSRIKEHSAEKTRFFPQLLRELSSVPQSHRESLAGKFIAMFCKFPTSSRCCCKAKSCHEVFHSTKRLPGVSLLGIGVWEAGVYEFRLALR